MRCAVARSSVHDDACRYLNKTTRTQRPYKLLEGPLEMNKISTIETQLVLLERVIIIATSSYGPTATDYLLVISLFIYNLR